MLIDLYSNMFNEEAILPYWLRHYETFVDRIFVWDNGSTDSTIEILNKHPKVTLLPRPAKHCERCQVSGLDDHYFIHALYPQYEKYSTNISDWVIVADADEFIFHPNIRKILEDPAVKRRKIIHCDGYTMIADKFPTTEGQIYEEVKMGIMENMQSKWTIHASDIVNFKFKTGRHGPPENFRHFRGDRNTGIKLLHYRFLGSDYIEARDRKNFESYTFDNNKLSRHLNKKGFYKDFRRRCPNGERMSIYEWLDLHKQEAINAVDIK